MTVPSFLGAIVDGEALLQVVWASLLAGVGVTGVFGIAIVGAARALDMSRDGKPAEAVVFGILGLLASAVVVAAIVFGIVVMTQKD
jgi:hypothetical protein